MFSPPCTPTSINTKGSVSSPARTTHLVNSALRLNPRSILPVFSHVGDQRSDAHKTIAFWTGTIQFARNASLRLKAMGLGPPILALYRQLKLLGALDGIDSVVEL